MALTSADVAALDRNARERRVLGLIAESKDSVGRTVREHRGEHGISAYALLFSGGNDSTALAHLFRDYADVAIHCNTGIGIEQTRDFVRRTCAQWAIPLMEEHPPPGSTYRELVLDQGFPGPAHHWKMYQRLKERGLRQAQRRLVADPRRERVVFLAGRRREESARRTAVPESERIGSAIWSSPLVNWTKLDLNTYRAMFDVPRNEVSDLLHMSGECLCGAFAKPGELDEIGMWFPEVADQIRALEREVEAAGQKRCKWGVKMQGESPSLSGPMCSTCDARYEQLGLL